MEIAVCCRACVALVLRKNVINVRGLASRTNGEEAEVESGVYEGVCGDAPVC